MSGSDVADADADADKQEDCESDELDPHVQPNSCLPKTRICFSKF